MTTMYRLSKGDRIETHGIQTMISSFVPAVFFQHCFGAFHALVNKFGTKVGVTKASVVVAKDGGVGQDVLVAVTDTLQIRDEDVPSRLFMSETGKEEQTLVDLVFVPESGVVAKLRESRCSARKLILGTIQLATRLLFHDIRWEESNFRTV